MRTKWIIVGLVLVVGLCISCQKSQQCGKTCGAGEIKISKSTLEDKIKGGWLGKTAGVCVGAPTEFKAKGKMFTGAVNLYPRLDGGFSQDDIYVQITFIAAMDAKLADPDGIFAATMDDYGEAFKKSGYELWHANKAGRDNLRKGIRPPRSGMWAGPGKRFNKCANDIDWQIECDWIGLMCPALPMTATQLSDRVGHVMNYGDGVYGGHYVSTMIALAFECNDVHEIVSQAIESMPRKSQYYQTIKDVIDFHDKNPDDFKACWKFINDKYLETAVDCNSEGDNFKIAASFNGAFITIGLLYGDGDILKTIEYATRCGQDSDCNPANAGAIVGTMLGYEKLPKAWKDSIEKYPLNKYSHTNYTFTNLINSSFKRAEKAILQSGGRLENNDYIIKQEPVCRPKTLEQYGQDPVPNPDFERNPM
ncbi:MAG: ADP-ribosylglycohydrolase family protein [Sedimentisphaerales bacterium]|jgi:ADP-ribosylglycohydrolase